MNTRLQRRNISRCFYKHSKKYELHKKKLNEFKELSDEELVGEIDGIYYFKSEKISTKTDNAGTTKTKIKHFIQTLDIEIIKEGMYVYIDNKKYEIIDIKNEANMSISYILTLQEG